MVMSVRLSEAKFEHVSAAADPAVAAIPANAMVDKNRYLGALHGISTVFP